MGCCPTQVFNGAEFTSVPKLHPDGRIELTEEPTGAVPGYKADPDNPKMLVPTWPACRFRVGQLLLNTSGNYNLLAMCNCRVHPLCGKVVGENDCKTCDVRMP